MRWPGANLEEKHEPRGVSVAKAQNGDSMKSSGRNLTLAAIEKRALAVSDRSYSNPSDLCDNPTWATKPAACCRFGVYDIAGA